jgi:peptidoglycan hydrolase-like protein with peptidoglycan-binding domain
VVDASTNSGPAATADVSDGGHSGDHPEMNFHVAVAPTSSDGDAFNTIRPALMTVACWRLDDVRFEFDSSFLLPEAQAELRRLGSLRTEYPDSPMSIFGHADPVGNDSFNKKLSGNRAMAIYAVLTRNTDMWETLHNDHGWGLKSTQRILAFLGFYQGPSDGVPRASSTAAVKAFQSKPPTDLNPDGDPGPLTRKKLYAEYMDAICIDAKGEPFHFDPAEFLGKGADPKGKAAYQGCSEFNPILLFSEQEDAGFQSNFDKKSRNAANAPNRRVVMFFFRPGVDVDVNQWPCPRADEGTSDCRKRFWSDSDVRLKLDDTKRRTYEATRDTFACRFYDRFARRSPCEAGYKEWIVQIMQSGPGELKDRKPLAGVAYVLSGVGTGNINGTTDANGVVRARVKADTTTMKLTLPTVELTLLGGALGDLDDVDPAKKGVRDRLYSLGYGPGNPAKWDADPTQEIEALKKFQADHGVAPSGTLDDATKHKLREIHGS